MSIHAKLAPEAEAKLKSQKRNSTISAIILSLLVCALIVAILFYIALSPLFKNTEELVTYTSGSEVEAEIEKPEMRNEVQKKPSAPSTSMAKVIAVNTPSAVGIPVPDVTAIEPSIDFGDGDDFGDGWGSGGSGSGKSGGGSASFFNQKIKAERICYVIDYSRSMMGSKIDLLKKELTKSISSLPDNVDYQLIFFSGPAWVAGDEVKRAAHAGFTVHSNGREYEWITNSGVHGYRPKDEQKMQPVSWLSSSNKQREISLEAIQSTELVSGTIWDYPLKMAINMNPKPDVIFFMTDGMAGKNSAVTAIEIGDLAAKEGVVINCVALMEPRAKESMGNISKLTGGIFTMVDADGKTTEVKLK